MLPWFTFGSESGVESNQFTTFFLPGFSVLISPYDGLLFSALSDSKCKSASKGIDANILCGPSRVFPWSSLLMHFFSLASCPTFFISPLRLSLDETEELESLIRESGYRAASVFLVSASSPSLSNQICSCSRWSVSPSEVDAIWIFSQISSNLISVPFNSCAVGLCYRKET